MNKLIATIPLFLFLIGQVGAQEPAMTLSIDSCRNLAMRNNKELRRADSQRQAAYYERKAAFTKYLPRVSATGAYLYTSKEISLLSDEQKEKLEHLGTAIGSMAPSLQGMTDALNGVGGSLVDALHTDTRNMGAVGVMLTQPVYMGGKIAAYNRITRYAEQVAQKQHDLALQEVIVEVDEAYWQIVSLQSKKRLAESYLQLVQKLDCDVQQMIAEGFATKADGLSVKVKVNEAQVTLIQVDNGLSLSRMLLCQLCGLEMNTPIRLADENNGQELPNPVPVAADTQSAFSLRPELNMLSLSADIYKEKVRLARAEFLPTVALTGGYLASNPSVFNSFERKMKGMWSAGILVNIPLVTFGERIYKVKAARAQYDMACNGARHEDKAAAGAQVERAQGAVSEVSSYMDETVLLAMTDGEVTEIFPEVGELVGTGAPILNISCTDDAWFTFNIREDLLPGLQTGTETEVYLPALDKRIPVRITKMKDVGSFAAWKATKALDGFDLKTFEVQARPLKSAETEGVRSGMSAIMTQPCRKQ